MLAEERRKKILEELEKVSIIKALTLAEKYDVGIETIRRDFDALEKKGILKKIYGGATLVAKDEIKNLDYNTRAASEIPEKIEIAKKAVNFISENDTIFLNDSSTNVYLAKEIKNKIKNITVVTNSLTIAHELSDMLNYNIVLAGGFLDTREKAFFGTISEKIISQVNVNKAILSVSNIALNEGVTDFPLKEVEIQKAMIKYSKEVIILANSQKFETSSLIKVTDLENIKAIITDSKINKKIQDEYKKIGIVIY
ncbi:MAG: DeoR/GlpR transcriptional regulator [Fusobacteriaceae bacterium]|nr:DeoR/GlpR transcriptional regulator [Fusobacteriaceae bacterium]MBP6322960.1 DeoR/GlpR transcriptional regulator [Fusobacteriaceae bacterium]MBP9509812.1 DeoR/GlpR transcriptional regulator [Fusobacteriaceae bacterium]